MKSVPAGAGRSDPSAARLVEARCRLHPQGRRVGPAPHIATHWFMDFLWSPWRLEYVTGTGGESGCVFCKAVAGDEEPLVIFRGATCFVILNKYPYNNGHLMVVPNRHVPSLASATEQELGELIDLARRAEIALGEAYTPHGLNMGINLGKPAGAGVLDHVHLHVVPRWNGDTNYMTVVGETRVLPEELPDTAARLRPIFERLSVERA